MKNTKKKKWRVPLFYIATIILVFLVIEQGVAQETVRTDPAPSTKEIKVQFPWYEQPQTVKVQVIDGQYIYQGDMLIPKDLVVQNGSIPLRKKLDVQIPEGAVGASVALHDYMKWPKGIIPYTINSNKVNSSLRKRIHEAIDELNRLTNLCVQPRNGQKTYVEFVGGSRNNWAVPGRLIGRQRIHLKSGASKATIMHEILHSAGFYHEHCRADRDKYIDIIWRNVKWGRFNFNFDRLRLHFKPHGKYDFESIMHYSNRSFGKRGRVTMKSKVPGKKVPTSSNTKLSKGDIAAIKYLYPKKHCSNQPGSQGVPEDNYIYAGTFRKTNKAQKHWRAEWSPMVTQIRKFREQGYHLRDIETLVKGGKRYYQGVFEKKSGKSSITRVTSYSAFQSKVKELRGKGYRLIDFETILTTDKKKRYFVGAFHTSPHHHTIHREEGWSNFVTKWKAYAKQGMALDDIELGITADGCPFYYGVFSKGDANRSLFKHYGWPDYYNNFKKMLKNGYTLLDFEIIKRKNKSSIYLSVYKKSNATQYMYSKNGRNQFTNYRNAKAKAGYQLADIEVLK